MASRLKVVASLSLVAFACACACPHPPDRAFSTADRFAFRNELRWTYHFDEAGRRIEARKTDPPPDYDLHCFPMARAAREFFYHARFTPDLPKASSGEYQAKVREIISRDSRCPSALDDRVLIPGYSNLAEFSTEHEPLLKSLCGGAISSYTQRGNWRMILPFSKRHQARTANDLRDKLERGFLPIIHLADFPRLSVNHSLLLTGTRAGAKSIEFEAYDPNDPGRTAQLRFDARTRRFTFERNKYFAGGVVDVYEVYKDVLF